MTLVELLVSQTIVMFIIAGVFSLVVAMTKSVHAADGAVQAQIRLREISHVLLRDLTALGGADGRAGELLQVDDKSTGPDELAVFKVNPGLCGGGLSVVESDGAELVFAAPCPFSTTNPLCSVAMLEDKSAVLVGDTATMLVKLSDVRDGAQCRATVSPSEALNDEALQRLRRELGGAVIASVPDALELLSPGSLRLGGRFSYRVAASRLERRVDDAAWEPIVDGVHDLQLARAYDVDASGTIESGEWLGRTPELTAEDQLAGASARTYFGVEVFITTFGKAADGIKEDPPQNLGNRVLYTPTADETRRRYRTSRLFMAARNRGGAS